MATLVSSVRPIKPEMFVLWSQIDLEGQRTPLSNQRIPLRKLITKSPSSSPLILYQYTLNRKHKLNLSGSVVNIKSLSLEHGRCVALSFSRFAHEHFSQLVKLQVTFAVSKLLLTFRSTDYESLKIYESVPHAVQGIEYTSMQHFLWQSKLNPPDHV